MSGPDYIPGYWQNETSGRLRPAVEAYLLTDRELTNAETRIWRAYLRQWINAPGFLGPEVEALRRLVHHIDSRVTLAAWLDHAIEAGCDPL